MREKRRAKATTRLGRLPVNRYAARPTRCCCWAGHCWARVGDVLVASPFPTRSSLLSPFQWLVPTALLVLHLRLSCYDVSCSAISLLWAGWTRRWTAILPPHSPGRPCLQPVSSVYHSVWPCRRALRGYTPLWAWDFCGITVTIAVQLYSSPVPGPPYCFTSYMTFAAHFMRLC